MSNLYRFIVLLLLLSGSLTDTFSKDLKVSSVADLRSAVGSAKPGDKIIVKNGTYNIQENIVVSAHASTDQPVTIEAESEGGAVITGAGGFIVGSPSSYIVIKGFNFTQNTGTFRIEAGATNCIVTRNIFECVPAGQTGSRPYLTVSGDDSEISYNIFRNKQDEGQMISVQGPGGDRMAKRTWIHHNYFYNFPPKSNNCSAIQIGLSGRSMDQAFCIVEYNLFEKTEGENEGAICHKSCNNIIRYNTFGERSEECSLRHGNNSQVYGNFFINTTGLRFSGDDHLIYNNYFKGCKKAIVCTNGDGEVKEGSKLTCHDRPDRVRVVYNKIVDCESAYQMPGRNNGLGATGITFSYNIISGGDPVSINGPYTAPVWKGNILINTSAGSIPPGGYLSGKSTDYNLKLNTLPVKKDPSDTAEYPLIPEGNRPLTPKDVGPDAK